MQMFSQWSKIYGETDISESNNDMVVLNDGYAILGRKEFKLWLIRTDLMVILYGQKHILMILTVLISYQIIMRMNFLLLQMV